MREILGDEGCALWGVLDTGWGAREVSSLVMRRAPRGVWWWGWVRSL